MIFPTIAGGTVIMQRFVKSDPAADNRAVQAGVGDSPIGIAQFGTRNRPYGLLDDGNCALFLENFHVFGLAEVTGLELGGTVAPGNMLMPDSLGRGIMATAGSPYGAIAAQAGNLGDFIEVMTWYGAVPTGGSAGGNPTLVTLAATSTLLNSYGTVLANATAGAITLTLPAAAAYGSNNRLNIKKTDSSANVVTIQAAGADLIDGATSVTLNAQYVFTEFTSDGVSQWWITSHGVL